MNNRQEILQLENVSKSFGGLCAVNRVNFGVSNGEILGLIGPNGAGKTTLFNVIAGFYKPTSGEIIFKGERISGLPPYEICLKGIARTFQQPQPFKGLSVYENILVAKLFGGDKRGLRRSGEEILALIGLIDKKAILVDNLTASEQKGMEIGKALACNPELLLLDEVGAGLNQVEQESIRTLVKTLNKNLRLTIVMIEHVMETVMNCSDRIVVLNNGEILKIGRPAEIANDLQVIEAYLGKEYVAHAEDR